MRRPRADPAAILLLTPILWGATFPGGKIVLRHLPVFTFMAWSRALGFLTILALLPLLRRSTAGQAARPWRAVIGPGIVLGGLMFLGYFLQTEGLARTTATNAGFITGLYIVFTPLMAAAAFRQRTPRSAWLAIAFGFAGLALLSITNLRAVRLHAGDLLVLAGAVVWAGHITAVGHFSPKFPTWMLSLAQMGAAAAFQLALAAPTGLRWADSTGSNVWPLLGLTGVLGSGVAFTIQVMAQRRLTPARAVVLLAGESLFSALFAAVWIGERLEPHQWLGAALVLGAMAYSELSARRPPSMQLEPATVE
jgi:drug/metabolite transporter (DMT)-like permease